MIKSCVRLPETVECIPLAVVIMTTANGKQPTFSGRRPKILIISDLYRVISEIAKVNTDIARSFFLSPLDPCYLGFLEIPWKLNKSVLGDCHRRLWKLFSVFKEMWLPEHVDIQCIPMGKTIVALLTHFRLKFIMDLSKSYTGTLLLYCKRGAFLTF